MTKPRILIINPPIRLGDKPRHIPHGLAIIANIIRKKLGLTPVFIDANAHRYDNETLASMLASHQFDIVLMGGLIPVYKRIIAYAEIIKRIRPSAYIVVGGSAGMSVPELLLKNSQVDAVCAGEGEHAIVDFIRAFSEGGRDGLSTIPGFYFKDGNRIYFSGNRPLIKDLDTESDSPAYDLLPMETYLGNPKVGIGRDVDIISSRGCPFQCTFCYQPWGRNFRSHSISFVFEMIKHLRNEYKIDFVSFQDDEFMADKKRVLEFCERVQLEAPGLKWSCTGRANLVSYDIAKVMRKAGCVSISYGFESGSSRMLESMNKHVTIPQMEEAIRINRSLGMMVPVSFIIGMPGEDENSCRQTIDFCVRNSLSLKSIMFATPYPGTAIFDFALKTGRLKKEMLHDFVMKLDDARDFIINLTDSFSDKALIAKHQAMIDEVGRRVPAVPCEIYADKMRALFGRLAEGCLSDPILIRHRAEHGGIDLF